MAAAAAAATIRCCRTFQLSSTKRSCCYCSSCCYCCSGGGGLRLLHPRQVQRARERVRPRRFLVASTTTNTFSFALCSSRARGGLHSVLSNSLDASPNCSQQEDDRESPPEGPVSLTGGIVALGKFDALHIGHRELAVQASKAGIPFLLSLVGMAEVFGWEMRAPIVAKCDRKRVLSSWAPYCASSVAPAEFHLEFSSIRHLSPRQFVEKLGKELGVRGVVAGENYRFGYKAAGDASELVKLCKEYGMEAYIVNSVMDKKQQEEEIMLLSDSSKEKGQVSSTRVRHALSHGDIKYVSELLGRNHRLVLELDHDHVGFKWNNNNNRIMSAPKSCLLNLAPKEGVYDKCHCLIGDTSFPCTTIIDATHIHVEDPNQLLLFQHNDSAASSLLSIEFGGGC